MSSSWELWMMKQSPWQRPSKQWEGRGQRLQKLMSLKRNGSMRINSSRLMKVYFLPLNWVIFFVCMLIQAGHFSRRNPFRNRGHACNLSTRIPQTSAKESQYAAHPKTTDCRNIRQISSQMVLRYPSHPGGILPLSRWLPGSNQASKRICTIRRSLN